MTNNRIKQTFSVGILIMGGVFVLIGLFNGEYAEVLSKAIYICLECIGIG